MSDGSSDAARDSAAVAASDADGSSLVYSDPPSMENFVINEPPKEDENVLDDEDSDDDDGNETDAEIHRSMPRSTNNSSSTQRSAAADAAAMPPPPPPPPPPTSPITEPAANSSEKPVAKKRKYTFQSKLTQFVPRFMKKIRESGGNIDGIMPASTANCLHELSLEELSTVPLEQIVQLRTVTRECEIIASENRYRSPSNLHDLRRLLRVYDDFALENRPKTAKEQETHPFDKAHQHALFITRMKILNVLENCEPLLPPGEENLRGQLEAAAVYDPYIQNYYYREAEHISAPDLAMWLLDKNACHPDMLVVQRGGTPGHRLQSCSLECFWQTMLSLMAAWPFLPMSGFVVRIFNEMRRRAAFFMSYREFSSLDAKRRFDEGERQIMGLSASLFSLVNFDAGAVTTPDNAPRSVDASGGLLDNFHFATVNDDGFVAVNMDFVDQCELIFHYMQICIRLAVGFVRSPLDSTLAIDNLVTPYTKSVPFAET
jgi:hypothetical protein